jgi:hypothetical protein
VQLLSSHSQDVHANVATIMHNLIEMGQEEVMVNVGAVAPLVGLLGSSSTVAVEQALIVVERINRTQAYHAMLIKAGLAESLVNILGKASLSPSHKLVMEIVTNLFIEDADKAQFVEAGVAKPLVSMLMNEDAQLRLEAARVLAVVTDDNQDCITSVAAVVVVDSAGQSSSSLKLILSLLKKDVDSNLREHVLRALVNLTTVEAVRDAAVEVGASEAMETVLESTQDDTESAIAAHAKTISENLKFEFPKPKKGMLSMFSWKKKK